MKSISWLVLGLVAVAGCAEDKGEQRITIIRPPEHEAPRGGISPDQMAAIQLVFQEHNSSANKCYQDVLDQKHSRGFQGQVRILLTIEPAGEASRVAGVKVLTNTLNDNEVATCLVDKIKGWDFPKVDNRGEFQQEYNFSPAY